MSDAPSSANWQTLLAQSVRSTFELLRMLGLDQGAVAGLPVSSNDAEADFPVRVPRSFVARMRPGDPSDPLLLQVLAQRAETHQMPGFSGDPLREIDAMPVPGLLHKYRSRALIITTGVCGVHCRYCFRRTFPYSGTVLDDATIARICDYIQRHAEIKELIFSGGDPLSMTDDRLHGLIDRLTSAGVRRLRIHTRMPIALPQRIDESFVRLLRSVRRPLTIVVHCNHPNELNEETAEAFRLIRSTGAALLNQSVLLRRINDDPGTLIELSESLFDQGVLPYYLNLLDPVTGTAHYDVPVDTARRIIRDLQENLSGYLVPKLVYEQPGAPSKQLVVISQADGRNPSPSPAESESRCS